ncbi:MAG: BamA/TamA family outer membrane protein [Candidatus Margulisiibacteriota bacterium]
MNKFISIIITLLILGSCALGSTLEAASKITAIEIKGNKLVAESEIRAALFSRAGENLDEQKLKNDLKAIYALGYFADATSNIEPFKDGSKVTYNVVENQIIKKLGVEGNITYSTAEIVSIINLKEGNILNYKTMRGDIETINQYYKKAGYAMSRVSDVSVSPDKKEVNFLIVEGIVEAVTLEGNDATQDYVILRELKTKAGKVFNEEVFSKDLRRVFNLGFFSEINPAFDAGTSPDKTIITLKIKETRTNTINFGGGYGEREGWFGFTDLAINNLLGTAQGLLLRGQFGQQQTTYQFRYTNPWFLPEKLGDRTSFTYRMWNTMGTDIYLTQQDEFHVGWDATLGKNLRDDFQTSYSLGSETVMPRGGASFEGYDSDFVGWSLSYDTRDFWMNPNKGVFHTISIKQGWKITSATTSYSKFGLDMNSFTPVRPQLVFAWHFGAGAGFGDIPLGELYWAGGPTTVRGYGLSEVQKGVYKLIANLEYRYTINDIFQLVTFFDWGQAWNAGYPDLPNFLTGWGPGVRLNTPLGPIRLDYGIGAGKNAGEGILHFSIGQAF